jgi:dihydroflavonol-4-reductase
LIFVTGATGLLGANVVRALLAAKHDVRVGVRARSDVTALADLPVERVSVDVTDGPTALATAFADCTAVIHVAAAVTAGRLGREQLVRVNVEGTRSVCRAVADHGARLVMVSSVAALGRLPDRPADETVPYANHAMGDPYSDTKAEADVVVAEHVKQGLDAVTVYPTYMLGPWDVRPSSGAMILAVAQGRTRIAPPGVNDFVDVRDVANSMVAALDRAPAGRGYILGGEALHYFDAWTRIARIVGAPLPLGTAPAVVVRALGAAGGLYTRLTGREPDVNPVSAAYGTLQDYRFSSDRARKELGHAQTDLDKAIADAWQWFVSHGKA